MITQADIEYLRAKPHKALSFVEDLFDRQQTLKPVQAELKMACGRWYVSLGGLVIAMETDPARDPAINGNRYEKENLEQLVTLINGKING